MAKVGVRLAQEPAAFKAFPSDTLIFEPVVIQGYLPLLTRPEPIVYFFRDVTASTPLPSRR